MNLHQAQRVSIATLIAFSFAITAGSLATGAELADKVKAIATQAIQAGGAVGLSIGIAQGEKVLLAEGYGHANLETNTPASAATVYRIGSITKQFTAVAVLQLAEREKLTLDDPLTKHITGYPESTVTIRQLLQHTSGIQSFTSLPSYRQLMRNDVPSDEMIDRFKDLPQLFEPGEKFRYCNSGYYLLGMIVESATGASYEQTLQDNLFRPLQLNDTRYDRTRQVVPHRASGYRRAGDGFDNAPFLSMTQPFAAGALTSNVTDLIRWQRALVDNQALNAESYKVMTTRGVTTKGKPIDYGLGLFIKKSAGRQTIGHGGGINGFRSDLMYYPDSDHTIVVLANSENAKPSQISKQIAKVLFESDD